MVRLAWLLLLLIAPPLCVVAALRLGPDPVAQESARPWIHREDRYVGSQQCRSCHPDQHASWEATFHRTMTQRPEGATVRGAFDGRTVELFGQRATPFAREGRFWFQLPDRLAEVALAVGSRRYQQYFERVPRGEGFALVRLPLLWHIEQQRWLHLNGVFLEPDDADWGRHQTLWNENCIFCHNTGPRPQSLNYAQRPAAAARSFDSEVADLGIACEACHGPGGEHIARHRDPLARYAAHAAGGREDAIVDPKRLDKQRAADVCGQCHGQRLPSPRGAVEAWMQRGPSFRPGNALALHVEPVQQATPSPVASDPDLFALRFWGDGTARLSAYEDPGLLQSPCFQKGELTCTTCHTMHGGDPRGQLHEAMRGDGACTQCHAAIARDLRAHTRHAPEGPGSRCLDCHLPRIVYGILTIHRSHRIENPDPKRDTEAGRPNACTLCHADQSPLWAAEQVAKLWGRPARLPERRPDGAPLSWPDASASLLAGDPLQRACYAAALGRGEPLAAQRAHLLVTLCDPYASVRSLAQASLQQLEARQSLGLATGLATYFAQAPMPEHKEQTLRLLQEFAANAPGRLAPPRPGLGLRPDFTLDLSALSGLLNLQSRRVISIGE